MDFGIAIFPTDYAISMAELAPVVEERGFESLWVAEHSHIPASRQSPSPRGGELPEQYWHTLDPFVALTVAAVTTRTLRVGTGICLVIEHDPIDTAKAVASADHVSGGRFLFGIGGGWNREEMADHGTRFETRWRLLRERIEAMKEIWTRDVAEYHGELVDFGPMRCWPKPVQLPHPPILLGGNGPNSLRRVVRYCDGWMPNRGDFLSRVPELREMAAEAGRGPIPVTAYGTENGGAAELERFREAGIARVIYYVPADGRDAALRRLDEVTELVRPFR
ncbi:MAG TPA: LLM class F420-dependent oxidoreductase [Candidatus Dormibacteraeota bacterium]|nr:LLM class F420-dependent oxidoreductase [Candidatus Dormibacteraeota bacterium]